MSKVGKFRFLLPSFIMLSLSVSQPMAADFFKAKDPGVRGGAPGAGGAIGGLTGSQPTFFQVGQEEFEEEETIDDGVGPRFNFVSCSGCHIQPAVGGTSPAVNPLFRVPRKLSDPQGLGFLGNDIPSFITPNGPIREARFKFNPDGSRDGGVHNLFVITGHPDALGCHIRQENFAAQLARNNVIFRIPTPTFGAGLIEAIPDKTIRDNLNAMASQKAQFGILSKVNFINVSGDSNNNGNDGTISRFGWKAQNKSLLLFSGEAYNVEMGITNELFQTERDETTSCQKAPVPNDVTNTDGATGTETISAIEKFSFFMRFLAPPTEAKNGYGNVSKASIDRGRNKFSDTGCALCHTPMLKTGNSPIAALNNKPVNLFADLGLHQMGPGLADDIIQGQANGDEFRTSPLWGLGKRIFFLHDGRTDDLIDAIRAHKSAGNSKFGPSEANQVIDKFNNLDEHEKQDLLNFLRSL